MVLSRNILLIFTMKLWSELCKNKARWRGQWEDRMKVEVFPSSLTASRRVKTSLLSHLGKENQSTREAFILFHQEEWYSSKCHIDGDFGLNQNEFSILAQTQYSLSPAQVGMLFVARLGRVWQLFDLIFIGRNQIWFPNNPEYPRVLIWSNFSNQHSHKHQHQHKEKHDHKVLHVITTPLTGSQDSTSFHFW